MALKHDCMQEACIQAIHSRLDRLEVRTDNITEMVKELKGMINKGIFLMIGAMLTAIVNLVALILTR